MSGESDEALMAAVRREDGEALAILFSRHHARVHALCGRLIAHPDAVEDLTQEVFFRVWRYAAGYAGRSAFRTWLYRLTFNVCSDFRRSVPSEVHWQLDDELAEPSVPEPGERQLVLEEALARLSADKRDALVLSRYEGLPFEEIGRVLGCTAAAARVRAHRALNELRAICRSLEKEQA